MAVAFDAFTNALGSNGLTFTHTPVGVPRAVIIHTGGDSGITGFTYGGVALAQMPGSPNIKAAAEAGRVQAWFLGSGIPTGAQSVVMASNGSTYDVNCITLTASTNTELVDVDVTINSDSVANPSITLNLLGRSCFCSVGFMSGQDAVTGITPLSGWTGRRELDAGTYVVGCYTYDTIGTTDVTAGWTQTADDAVAIAIAVSELAPYIDIPLITAPMRPPTWDRR